MSHHPSPSSLRDQLGNASLPHAAQAAMSVADAIQNFPAKGVRLMGLTSAFLLAADESGIPVPDLMSMARNCVNHAEGRRPEFAAVADFIKHEIL